MKNWWQAMMSYPATWVVVTFVVAAVAAILVLLEPPGFMIAVLFGLAAVSLAAWPLALTVTGTLNRLQFSLPRITEVDEEEMAKLVEELEELEDPAPHQATQVARPEAGQPGRRARSEDGRR